MRVPEGGRDTGERELVVDALAAGGRGVARDEGRVWFVPGALPGDRVLARPVRVRTAFVEGALVRRIEDSPDRRPAPCPYQERCGGCPWMPLDETVQRRWKERLVGDALRRIGDLGDVPRSPIAAPSAPLAYRNRTELRLGRDASGKLVLGFGGVGDSSDLVDIPECAVQHPRANAVLATVRAVLAELPNDPRGRMAPGREPRLILRHAAASGKVLVVLRESGVPFPRARRLANELMRRHSEVAGVVRQTAPGGRRGGARSEALAGADSLPETIARLELELPAGTFVQVSAEAGEALVGAVERAVGPPGDGGVLDLYGGIGLYGMTLARGGHRPVTVCDADVGAVRCGRRAARGAGLAGIRFVHADVGRFLRTRAPDAPRPRVIVANPPRTGLGRGVARGIAALGAARVVMVSCDPATLARDLRPLARAGYEPLDIRPFDVFPQTAHVETVVLLVRGMS